MMSDRHALTSAASIFQWKDGDWVPFEPVHAFNRQVAASRLQRIVKTLDSDIPYNPATDDPLPPTRPSTPKGWFWLAALAVSCSMWLAIATIVSRVL